MYTRILVPLDGSELAEKALPHAQGLARDGQATIHLVQVFTRHPRGGYPIGKGLEADQSVQDTLAMTRQVEATQIESAQEYLEHLASQLEKDGISVETALLEGHAYEEIVNYTKKYGIDLVVMCTHGHGGIKRLLLGSVTDRVVRMGDVPVLIVPSHSER
jgi:nucleotide-binding universal stress UspA family protein